MKYELKTLRVDEEVMEWLEGLREMYGSYNKGLRVVFGLVAGRIGELGADSTGLETVRDEGMDAVQGGR